MRSRWNEADKPLRSRMNEKQPAGLRGKYPVPCDTQENRSEINRLAEDHRAFVLGLLMETRRIGAASASRMLLLLLAACVLLVGLALSAGNIFGGSGLISVILRLAYVLGAGSAALILLASMAFAVYGAASIWEANSGSSLPAEPLPRQTLLNLARAEVAQMRQAQQRCARIYRRAVLLFLFALLPYTLAMAILFLQVL